MTLLVGKAKAGMRMTCYANYYGVDGTFFEGHSASIHVSLKDDSGKLKQIVVGEFGILHPTVLKNYELA